MRKQKFRLQHHLVTCGPEFNNSAFTVSSDGYGLSLFQCAGCGEIYVVDFDDPSTAGKPIAIIAQNQACPTCGAALSQSLHKHPEFIRTRSGKIFRFQSSLFPDENEEIVDAYLLEPDND